MKKEIEKHIKRALASVENILAVSDENGNKTLVYEEYDGYAASFGASVVTSGLLPTLSFYTDVHKKDLDKNGIPVARRFRILICIAYILESENLPCSSEDKTALLDYAIEKSGDNSNLKQLKHKIIAASVALKLALRNFKHIKSPAGHES